MRGEHRIRQDVIVSNSEELTREFLEVIHPLFAMDWILIIVAVIEIADAFMPHASRLVPTHQVMSGLVVLGLFFAVRPWKQSSLVDGR